MPQRKDKDPFERLREAAASKQQGYKNSPQMFDDFRGLFFDTERGKRVFHQIMDWGGMFRSSVIPGDPYGTHVREGERSLSAHILSVCIQEPKQLPTKQNRRQ